MSFRKRNKQDICAPSTGPLPTPLKSGPISNCLTAKHLHKIICTSQTLKSQSRLFNSSWSPADFTLSQKKASYASCCLSQKRDSSPSPHSPRPIKFLSFGYCRCQWTHFITCSYCSTSPSPTAWGHYAPVPLAFLPQQSLSYSSLCPECSSPGSSNIWFPLSYLSVIDGPLLTTLCK